VSPFSVPATNARYTDRGSRFRARTCASATVSNQSFVLAMEIMMRCAALSAGHRPPVFPGARRVGKPGAAAGVDARMTQPFEKQPVELDLHSEYLRADLFLAMGQPAEAARIVARVVDAEPANEAALELLARSYFGSAQLGRAQETLVRLVALAPANGWARRALARTLERRSRRDEAAVHHRIADALGAA
jgi:predicted Zn-dependent protease